MEHQRSKELTEKLPRKWPRTTLEHQTEPETVQVTESCHRDVIPQSGRLTFINHSAKASIRNTRLMDKRADAF